MRTYQRLLVSLLAAVLGVGLAAGTALAKSSHAKTSGARGLPERRLDKALQLDGSMSNGVLTYSYDRSDMNDVTIHGVPIEPAFEINGEMDFQPLGGSRAFLNGDLPVTTSDIDQTVSTIIRNRLTFQAEHQHFYDFSPMVWFIHIRARGNALSIAKRVHRVLVAAGLPLPQSSPSNPKTPFNVVRLKRILHAYHMEISEDGIATFYISRRDSIYIDGIRVNPSANIATNVSFEPLNSSGSYAAVVPDYGMETREVNRVIGTMRSMGWDIGCLYNQETGETPQLYFSHDFKTGDPYTLAHEVRKGLNQMNSH